MINKSIEYEKYKIVRSQRYKQTRIGILFK